MYINIHIYICYTPPKTYLLNNFFGICNDLVRFQNNGNAHGNANSTANGHSPLTRGNAMWDLDAIHHNATFPVTCGSLMLVLIAMVVPMAMLMVLVMAIHP